MNRVNQRIILVSRPQGEPSSDNFRFEEVPIPPLADGQVLVHHHYLSLDPYMRGRMSDAKSYAPPQPLGEVMIGATVGEVVESRHRDWRLGDTVTSLGGWQQYAVVDASRPGTLRKVDASRVPISAYLGVLGMPGVTAWYGLTQICAPEPGRTLVVSAASGAVGSVVGQLAKTRGCRAVGIAGGAEKCDYVTRVLGFDACIDYKANGNACSLDAALQAALPDGADACFENVGGQILDAVMLRMNAFGRIAICGMIAGYNGEPIPMRRPQLILQSRLRVEGFIVSEHLDLWPKALVELGQGVASGAIRYRESIAEGLGSAPQAFLGLLRGRNFGKQLVKLV